ncbi:MAG: hypothetical protein ACKO96_05205 [Flammeovirgaceae bacterium]
MARIKDYSNTNASNLLQIDYMPQQNNFVKGMESQTNILNGALELPPASADPR